MILILLYLSSVLSCIWNLVVYLLNRKFNLRLVSSFTKRIPLWSILLNIYEAFLFYPLFISLFSWSRELQKSFHRSKFMVFPAACILQAFKAVQAGWDSRWVVDAHAGYPARNLLPFLGIPALCQPTKLQFFDKNWVTICGIVRIPLLCSFVCLFL